MRRKRRKRRRSRRRKERRRRRRRKRRRRRRRRIGRTKESKRGKSGEKGNGGMRPTPKIEDDERSRERRTAEKMASSVREKAAFWAERVRSRAESRLIVSQLNAMAGAEARETSAGDTRERSFRFPNRRRTGSQNPVWLVGTNRFRDEGRVD